MFHSEKFEDATADGGAGAVAITGMACRFAGARTPEAFWAMLRDGIEGIVDLSEEELLAAGVPASRIADPAYVWRAAPLDDMECFDAGLFGLSPRDAAIMDPQHRHFLECAWEALESAGCDPARFAGAIGVFGGSGHNAYMPYNLLTNPRLVRDTGLFLLRHTGNDKDFLTSRVSYLLNLRGPSVGVQTACSTSLVAVHAAIQSLLSGECDMALAGGVSIDLPHRQGYLHEDGGILSPDGRCRAFDAGSRGTVFGSGVGIVALRRLDDAIEAGDTIHAVIRGSAVNNDGAGKISYLAPSVDGHAGVVSEALGIAGIDPATIGYVEAHGTGTPVGDPIEVAALTQAYREGTDATGYCAIGSVKGNIGHTDTAAGVAGLIKVAMAMRHRTLPGTLHLTTPSPACGFAGSPFAPIGETRPWRSRAGTPLRAGVSSLGVGGTNAHVVVEEAPPAAPGGPTRSHQLLTISARSDAARDGNAAALAEALAAPDAPGLADAAYTLSLGRRALHKRLVAVASDRDEAAALLADPAGSGCYTAEAVAGQRAAFLFCGAGAQYAGMARDLYAREPLFRTHVDAALDILAAQGAGDIRRWLLAIEEDAAEAAERMRRPLIALPALFVVQVALGRLLIAWGVEPDGMIGHSSGEYAAAHLAGTMRLEDGLRLVRERGRLFETLPLGAMLSIPMPADALGPLLPDGVSIAAVNAPELCVASGPDDAIAALAASLADRGVETQPVRISVAAHSAMLDPILPSFRETVRGIALSPPSRRFVSNLTGRWITDEDATDPEYWVRHLRETVRFTDGLATLLDGDALLVEVGPGRTMTSLARQHPACGAKRATVRTMRQAIEPADDVAMLLDGIGRMWAHGIAIDWPTFWADETRRRVPLPTYRFDRERHWIEPGPAAVAGDAAPDETPGGRRDLADWFYEPVWRRAAASAEPASDTGPVVLFADARGIARVLERRYRAAGRRVTIVSPGRRFRRDAEDRFTIRCGVDRDWRMLADRLGGEWRPSLIVHAWLVTGTRIDRDRGETTERAFHGLLQLARALGEGDAARLLVVTDGAQRVAGEPVSDPAKALALGPCRTIPREYPGVSVRSVDLSPDEPVDAAADAIVAEARCAADVDAVAWRRGERWVQNHDRVRRDAPGGDSVAATSLRPGGVYVVTGGLGGIGLALARYLARRYAARLVLIGRTPLPPRSEWERHLRSDDGAAARIEAIFAMEADGAEVMTIAADVADAPAVTRALRAARRRFGAINGVFHAAGILDDGPIETKDRASAAAVLAPKVDGAMALAAALDGDRPDFVMLFSSVSAFAGLPGQVDYAAANAFLDTFAQARAGKGGPPVVSLAWSRWRDVGMVADRAPDPLDRPRGDRIAIDHPLLATIHRTDDGLTGSGTPSAADCWVLDEHRSAEGVAVMPGTGHLELIRTLATTALATPAIRIEDVAFLVPFAVVGAARDLRVRARPEEAGAWTVAVLGRDPDRGGAWIEHATATVRPLPESAPERLPIAAIRARCTARGDAGATFATPHLRFGARWDTVRSFDFGDGEALLGLTLAAGYEADLDHCALHPALLDFATAGAQQVLRAADGFLAPLSYGTIRFHAPLPATIVSHIRVRADEPGEARFDVTIATPDGDVLVEIEDFTMVRLADSSRLGAMPGGEDERDREDAALSTAEGMAVIERVLAVPAPHVIVLPQDLAAVVARGRAPARAAPGPRLAGGDAPATEMEAIVAALWGEMLGVEDVGRDDDFYDMGGHSLLAVQFINRLRKRTGRQLALAALLDRPTVARIAAQIDAGEAPGREVPARAASDVVTIREGTGPTPLFLIHDGLAETLLYRSLAHRLDVALPVYGIEPSRRPDGEYAHTSIAAMASDYVRRVRARQPQGPYLLAGLCAGGVIAFEMARRLQDAGETVAFVGIIDAADTEALRRRGYIMGTRIERIRALLAGGGVSALPRLAANARNAALWEVSSRLERLRRRKLVAGIEAGAGDAARAGPVLPFLHLYEVAHAAHRPEGLFDGGIVALFRAMQSNGADDDLPYRELYPDRVFGWGKRVADDIVVVDVPGGHTSVLQEPNVGALACAIQAQIDAALSVASIDGAFVEESGEIQLVAAE